MLVLTAKKDKVIHIGDDIILHIKGVSQGQVKLGFEAPDHINIVRKEVLDRAREKGNA